MKERVTVTLESDILHQVDMMVDGYNLKNRSHAIEVMLYKALGKNKLSKAIILAGGKIVRYKGFPANTSSAMLTINNKPILQYNIELLRKYGIKDIIIAINQKSQNIKEYFGDGRKFGVKITYLEESTPIGTGGPLRMAKPMLKDIFLVCNGDELKDVNIDDLVKFHNDKRAFVTIALTSVNDPSKYGVAQLHGDKILHFTEKPKKGTQDSNLINAGLYVCEPRVLENIPKGQSSMEKDVFPAIAKDRKLFGFTFSGQWIDCGNKEGYDKAMKEWKGFS